MTDFVDGYLARRLEIVSDVGKILDPLADKILILVFLPLLQMQAITAFPIFLILAREFIVMALRVFAAKNGLIMGAGFSGKLKTLITLPVCGVLFARIPVLDVPLPAYLVPINLLRSWVFGWPSWVFDGLIWVMVGVTLWSLADYMCSFLWQSYLRRSDGDPKRAKQKLRLLIPNAVTFVNLCCGVLAVIYAWFHLFHSAVLLVLLGTLLDALDGKLARRLNAFSKFGAKLDSKADYVNFGIAPAVVVFQRSMLYGWPLALFLGLIYYSAVHYRLRRFDQSGHSDYFEGVPSPVGAGLVVLAAISTYLSTAWVFSGIVILLAGLMVSRIPYPHLDVANRETFLRYLRVPILLFLVLTMLQLLQINFAKDLGAYEVLFGLTCTYLVFPVLRRFSRV